MRMNDPQSEPDLKKHAKLLYIVAIPFAIAALIGLGRCAVGL